jgi:hypothetical protein
MVEGGGVRMEKKQGYIIGKEKGERKRMLQIRKIIDVDEEEKWR